MSDTGHTPLPWSVVDRGWQPWPDAIEINGRNEVICFTGGHDADQQKANAAYIVTACNAFPALVEALKRAVDDPYYSDLDAETRYEIEQALAKSEASS